MAPFTSWSGIGGAYQSLWSAVLRPPRATMTSSEKGGSCCWGVRRGSDDPVVYERLEISVQSVRGHTLQCSYFTPGDESMKTRPRPCVVFLHGMAGCRLDVVNLLPYLLRYDITVCSVDFSGSGESEGEYVSLGHYEQEDLRVVLDLVRSFPSVTSVALWGWSMGAVVAILRASEDDAIAACVLDSPFADLSTVFREFVDVAMPMLPQVLVSLGVELVRHEAKTRAGFDPTKLRPVDRAGQASCPALFGVADCDSVTRPHHTDELFKAWGGSKRISSFHGTHDSKRPDSFLREAASFLWKHLQLRSIADGYSFPDTPEADSVFLVEPGGAFHLSTVDAFSFPSNAGFRRPSVDAGESRGIIAALECGGPTDRDDDKVQTRGVPSVPEGRCAMPGVGLGLLGRNPCKLPSPMESSTWDLDLAEPVPYPHICQS
eukprot:TRINITY_DN20843_c0_g1_i1.p1 TRINITY_DN20843_c0_g1~~TRINITY_DN20843_c0_g1_i1.p1  ORF type:complete len:458 (+),score=57.02 TRINITY_DN20843_c0_g1_i1:81-1376(+)